MASTGRRLSCLVLIFLFLAIFGSAFKEAEFRKCHQSKFCKDVRERAAAWARGEGGREIEVREVKVSGEGRLTARLIPAGVEEEALALELSAYRDGIVRIRVLEEKATRKRFEVPDVVVAEFEQKRLKLSRVVEKEGASVVQLSGHEVTIQHKPFQVSDRDLCLSLRSERNLLIGDVYIHNAVICVLYLLEASNIRLFQKMN